MGAFRARIDGDGELFDLCASARLGGFEGLRPDEDDRGLLVGFHRGELGASEVGHFRDEATILRGHVARVGDEADAQPGREPACDLARVGREPEQDKIGRALLVQGLESGGRRLGDEIVERSVLVEVDDLRPVLAERGSSSLGAGAPRRPRLLAI